MPAPEWTPERWDQKNPRNMRCALPDGRKKRGRERTRKKKKNGLWLSKIIRPGKFAWIERKIEKGRERNGKEWKKKSRKKRNRIGAGCKIWEGPTEKERKRDREKGGEGENHFMSVNTSLWSALPATSKPQDFYLSSRGINFFFKKQPCVLTVSLKDGKIPQQASLLHKLHTHLSQIPLGYLVNMANNEEKNSNFRTQVFATSS